jgi:hypothetical protein
MSVPDGIYARIPLGEVTLTEACDLVEDKGEWFHTTRIAVLFYFSQVTVDGYWNLSVGTHGQMVDFLIGRGFYEDGGAAVPVGQRPPSAPASAAVLESSAS